MFCHDSSEGLAPESILYLWILHMGLNGTGENETEKVIIPLSPRLTIAAQPLAYLSSF